LKLLKFGEGDIMVQCHLIGAYAKESDFTKELNDFIAGFNYENIEIQFRMVMNEREVLYSALVIIKDCK